MRKVDTVTAEKLSYIKAQVFRIKGGDERKARCKGESELLSLCEDKKLTQRQAIFAECFVCQGYYVDGKEDCKNKTCPLYFYMPYREGFKEDIRREKKDVAGVINKP